MAGKKKIETGETAVCKAPLSEIFAAMSGVIYAGIGNAGLTGVAGEMAGFSYDLKTALFQSSPAQLSATSENIAQKALAGLKSVQPKLLDHANAVLTSPPKGKIGSKAVTRKKGGTALDVFTHIASILDRENIASMRPREKLTAAGNFPEPFKAGYLPEFYSARKCAKKTEGAAAETPYPAKKSQPALI